ncbi:MAG: peptidase M14 [Verrucomicrobia bacterium]|nr:MAG: peptidase M14 [Verrucomicrobiota bacterium]
MILLPKSFLILAFLLCAATTALSEQAFQIDANFPGGNIQVTKIESNTVSLHQDLRDTAGWWFYWCFRVRGGAGKTISFHFTNGNPIGVCGPAVSLDEGATWAWLGHQPKPASFTYIFPPTADSVRFCFGMGYTQTNLDSLLDRIGPNPALKRETLCQSRQGRAVERLRVGKLDGEPRFRVMVTCRAHSCEMMTSYLLEGLMETALARGLEGEWFRQNVEMLIIPFVDKDGVEDGDQGKNRRPRDHNRDYDEHSIYPETKALREFVPQWSRGKLRLALDLHCPNIRGEFSEVIYLVGSRRPDSWRAQQRFGGILERAQTGPLVYHAADNLPFGQQWNTLDNFKQGTSAADWAASLPGVKMATSLEFPYANAGGREVNQQTARAFGQDLARAVREYVDR